MSLPLTKKKNHLKKLPSPDKKSQENKNTQEKGEKNENSWTAPPKIQVDVDDLLQRAKAISIEVQEHGLMFNLEEVRQDQKKKKKKERCLSLLWRNGHVKSLNPPKTWSFVKFPAWA